jgi:aspartyl-tRNA(Asn)/glutamyl-tRNA(Gln) amidotransferase subunit C
LGSRVTVSRAEIERIAQLAALSVEPDQLAELTKQIGDILAYVAQLDALETEHTATDFHPGPPQTPLRPDGVRATTLTPGPSEMAPEFAQGYYLVPRLEALGGDE